MGNKDREIFDVCWVSFFGLFMSFRLVRDYVLKKKKLDGIQGIIRFYNLVFIYMYIFIVCICIYENIENFGYWGQVFFLKSYSGVWLFIFKQEFFGYI